MTAKTQDEITALNGKTIFSRLRPQRVWWCQCRATSSRNFISIPSSPRIAGSIASLQILHLLRSWASCCLLFQRVASWWVGGALEETEEPSCKRWSLHSQLLERTLTSGAHSSRPVYIFFGGVVQMVAAVGEWVIGNTFSCTLFFYLW